ncbi:hydrogenase maturation protease [Sulfobacillus thermosulfidooxidans]|uniref:hydrogenase maturation protease n=1 Tax=Sulfobacillus thermosulfidooxidans TaxID=28034 RepID=UPI000B1E1775|nr:hydrogenase maturation protease [Sulfobacillus thermosulfidooxidans]
MTPSMEPAILVAGIGNIFLGDDGFGVEVIRRLIGRPSLMPMLVFQDFGIRSVDLVYALHKPWKAVILVDAYAHGEKPGHLQVIHITEEDIPTSAPVMDGHSLNPLIVLVMAKQQVPDLPPVYLVGCQPLTFGPEEGLMELSAPVEAAIEGACHLITTLGHQLAQEE